MERLTKRELIELKDGQKIVACNSKDDECNDYCMHGYCKWNDEALKKLKEYEDAEEQGLLIRLPCKVGDVVYTNMRASGWYKREKNKPYKANVAFIGINGKDNFMNVVFENDNVLQFLLSDIGKTVFLTREEAEAALERMSEKENENE